MDDDVATNTDVSDPKDEEKRAPPTVAEFKSAATRYLATKRQLSDASKHWKDTRTKMNESKRVMLAYFEQNPTAALRSNDGIITFKKKVRPVGLSTKIVREGLDAYEQETFEADAVFDHLVAHAGTKECPSLVVKKQKEAKQ